MKHPLLVILAAVVVAVPTAGHATTYYVRQTVGSDSNDGRSRHTAWEHFGKLMEVMRAGDTAYVGPGLYRDGITVLANGTASERITFIADSTGQHTGDPPGIVMVTGADPVDESAFKPAWAPNVYQYAAREPQVVLGVVEMDGPQHRYARASDTREHLIDKTPEREVVARRPSTFFYDREANVLYIQTSDGKAPKAHEIELVHRGNGIAFSGNHFVTVIGFTFRHLGDAGINFFKGTGDGIAIHNTSYGSRQGIRVYNATNVLIYGNTLFRNENSGVYFAAESANGHAIRNTSFDNVKGVRWSSDSVYGIAMDNALFDNQEAGVSIENANHALVRGNRMVNNARAQLLLIRADYSSEDNCFANNGPDQVIAEFVQGEKYKTLAAYQAAERQDTNSREGQCGPLPAKVDVHRLHAETTAYLARARAELKAAAAASPPAAGSPAPTK
jgi:parallel beta-helix repeat protein